MKFYELDLRQIIPYGIPLNTESHVEYTEHINDFFLQGFENYFHRFYTTDLDGLSRDYSRSCTAPNSLLACQFCTDAQLQAAITEAGFAYYSTNDHDNNAKFLYNLSTHPFGTTGYLTTIAQYVSNSNDIYAEPIYEGYDPYTYGIRFYGDISGSVNALAITNRMIENLSVVGTAHTQVNDFQFEDSDSEIDAFVACVGTDVSINYEVEIPSEPSSLKAFLRSAQYQNVNKSLSASSQNILYAEGGNAGLLADINKTYTLTGVYNKDGLPILYGDAHLYTTLVIADPPTYQLRLMWDSQSSANVCYIEYTEY